MKPIKLFFLPFLKEDPFGIHRRRAYLTVKAIIRDVQNYLFEYYDYMQHVTAFEVYDEYESDLDDQYCLGNVDFLPICSYPPDSLTDSQIETLMHNVWAKVKRSFDNQQLRYPFLDWNGFENTHGLKIQKTPEKEYLGICYLHE